MRRVLLVSALGALSACKGATANGSPPPASRDPSAKNYVGATLPKAHVILIDSLGSFHAVEAEVAATNDSRTRGLMWRTELADGKGMLFIFPAEEAHAFWMKNTLIPLDMVFINKDARVVGFVRNAEPKSLKSLSPGGRSKYVLEVPAGWTERTAIAEGSRVRFEGLANVDVE